MKFYSVSISPEYGWLMYSGREPMFNLIVDILREELPAPGELTIVPRQDGPGDGGLHLNLLALPADRYRTALEILADGTIPRARAALYDGELIAVYPHWEWGDDRVKALGDIKTVALIARNVLARMG
ncbi:hypothetical protein [Streptomyces sp. NPDC088733]|uniref:hypothetical protein n=1 Tax=Streptomyces sp. NPDC088733 TaxID=3365880 RepID=UPI0038112BCD